MADPKTWVDMVPKYLVAGVEQQRVIIDTRTVVGPASYVAEGIPVDLSAVFSTLHSVAILRAYVTSTGITDTRVYDVNETGTDTLANRKFRIKVSRIPTPVGTNSAPTITTNTGAVTNVIASSGGILTQTVGSSGITGVQAPSFTGTAPTISKAEISAATDLSTITIEYEARGVFA